MSRRKDSQSGDSDRDRSGTRYVYPSQYDETRVKSIRRRNKRSGLFDEVFLDKDESRWDSGAHGVPAWRDPTWVMPAWLKRDWCTRSAWDAHADMLKRTGRAPSSDSESWGRKVSTPGCESAEVLRFQYHQLQGRRLTLRVTML